MSKATADAIHYKRMTTDAEAIRLLTVQGAASDPWTAPARDIIRDYAASLDIDIGFQGFEAEMAALPGDYIAPRGLLLLAVAGDGRVAACGGFRPLTAAGHANACEMKRLYARPAFRGLGLGRRVAEALMAGARAAGYGAMLLDTLEPMAPARALYASLGFVEVAPYYANPLAGVRYLKADL